MKRHALNFAPEVAPQDLEASPPVKVFGGGQTISMAGAPLNIQPYQAVSSNGKSSRQQHSSEGVQKVAWLAGVIWLVGCFLGYDWTWPLYVFANVLYSLLSTPPLSWFFGWATTPLSWVLGWAYRGAPLVSQLGALQELRLPPDQVSSYLDSYVQQYGDAALIFASHDGYPQIVNGLLYNRDLGYRDLIDAADDNGNTALIYAAAKGYRQCTAALLRNGADPDLANQGGGGRTPLMEAAGAGNKDITSAIRLSNATVDATDDFGNTALHYAAYHGHLTVVHELLKSNPRRDLKNSYGHTAASYAQANKHKAVADVLNRAPTRREKLAQDSAERAGAKKPDALEDVVDYFGAKRPKEEKHVHFKGGAEDLHKRDINDFMPKLEHTTDGITDFERKSLEEQIAKLKRQHEEAELHTQRRIVELLEKSAAQQKALDEAERHARTLQLNATELSIKIQELQSRHQGSELRALDEKQRADRLHEDMQRTQLEVDRHRSRADGAERERDVHMEANRRNEESLRSKYDEVKEHLSRIERQTREINTLREDLRRRDEEVQQHRDTIAQLQHELQLARGAGAAGNSAIASPATNTVAGPEDAHRSAEGPEAPAVPAAAAAEPAAGGEAGTAPLGDAVNGSSASGAPADTPGNGTAAGEAGADAPAGLG